MWLDVNEIVLESLVPILYITPYYLSLKQWKFSVWPLLQAEFPCFGTTTSSCLEWFTPVVVFMVGNLLPHHSCRSFIQFQDVWASKCNFRIKHVLVSLYSTAGVISQLFVIFLILLWYIIWWICHRPFWDSSVRIRMISTSSKQY